MNVDLVVIGLGYVGLPLAQEAVRSGLTVTGLDVSPEVVRTLMDGRSHVDDLSDADIGELLGRGFTATTDVAVVADAETVVVCVPTPLSEDGGPDLTAVLAATRSAAEHLRSGALLVLESTTYPGTTEDVVRPLVERPGRSVGQDVHLAFSPERIDPGNQKYGFRNTPKVVGGCTPACTERVAAFYGRLVDEVVVARGTREAETAKLLENTYRHVNIALVNEMAKFCHDLDIDLWDVIRCASTKPFGFQAFYPGPGVGGHCIPIDPNYLSYTVRAQLGYPFRFVELAQEINHGMPGYVVSRVQQLLNDHRKPLNGSRVLLLGVTYKADIGDQRESPATAVADHLVKGGAEVSFHDPYVRRWTAAGRELDVVLDLPAAILESDVVVLLQAHSGYDVTMLSRSGVPVLDTRGVLPESAAVQRL